MDPATIARRQIDLRRQHILKWRTERAHVGDQRRGFLWHIFSQRIPGLLKQTRSESHGQREHVYGAVRRGKRHHGEQFLGSSGSEWKDVSDKNLMSCIK
jgi:hypothetical protein